LEFGKGVLEICSSLVIRKEVMSYKL